MNISDSSCVPFGWKGRYAGPGKFSFAFPSHDNGMAFTGHSTRSFLKDDKPRESIILDEAIVDSELWADTVFVATSTNIRVM